MEILSFDASGIKLKSKKKTILINPTSFTGEDVSIVFDSKKSSYKSDKDGLIVASTGEYEFGGLKISGTKLDGTLVFNIKTEGVEILLGKLSNLKQVQSKLQDISVVCVYVDEDIDPGFISSIASSVLVLFGEKAGEVVSKYHAQTFKKVNKLLLAKDKLPQVVESYLIA